jgi:hypothetical protein
LLKVVPLQVPQRHRASLVARQKLVALSLGQTVSDTLLRRATTKRPFGLSPVDWALLLIGFTLIGLLTLLI